MQKNVCSFYKFNEWRKTPYLPKSSFWGLVQQLLVLEAIALLWPTQWSTFPPIGAGLYKKLNSLDQVFWGEWKVLWKNLGCLCRLAAWFIILFQKALWLSGGLFICLVSSGNAVWAKGLSALHRAVQTLWFIYDRVRELLIMLPFLQGNVYETQSFPAQILIETLIALFPEI